MNIVKRIILKSTGRGQYVRIADASSRILLCHRAPGMIHSRIQKKVEAASAHAAPVPSGTVSTDRELESTAYTLVFLVATDMAKKMKFADPDNLGTNLAYRELVSLIDRIGETMVYNGYLDADTYHLTKLELNPVS